MQKQKIVLTGLILPLFPAGTFVLLVLLSFSNSTVSSVIAADKLILLTAGLSPVIYALGIIVSIIALVKSEMKAIAFIGAALNIFLLIGLLYFGKSILMEFEFVS